MIEKNKILIVEDEAIIAQEMKIILEQQGYIVCPIASRTGQAIRYTSEYKPHIVLMDIILKGSDSGIEAARIIGRENHVPIIFLTGNPDLLDKETGSAEYFGGIVVKPPSITRLTTLISQALDSRPSGGP